MSMLILFCVASVFVYSEASLLPSVTVPTVFKKRYLIWSGGIYECEGYKNRRVNIDKLIIDKKDKDLITLVGDLIVTSDTTKDLALKLDVFKKVNEQWEYLFNVKVDDLCNHLSEKNKPWTPFMEQMKVKSCPIHKGTYTFRNATLDTAGFPFTEANDGSYKAQAEIYENGKLGLCVLLFADIGPMS